MPLQQTSGAASYDAFGGGAPVAAKYIEDFFQSWLRTGTGSSTTVTTGLNASINKSLVWTKSRSAATNHKLTDTARGVTKALSSNTTGAEVTDSQGLTAFSSTGYTIGTNTDYNNSGATYVDWQWVATPKFFDVVTYTGNGTGGRAISHTLGSVPGCIIVKRTDTTGNWAVYHRSTGNTGGLRLNATDAFVAYGSYWADTTPTETAFTVGGNTDVNASGGTYVAYLFAHNAGGFGLTGTDNVISCGSFTTDGSGNATVNLGYEPQWTMTKRTDSSGVWSMNDVMRGMPLSSGNQLLEAQSSAAESTGGQSLKPNATGFTVTGTNASATFIYIAIRRGPMKVPTSGTSVFVPYSYSGNGGTSNPEFSFSPDTFIGGVTNRASFLINMFWDRIRGSSRYLQTSDSGGTQAEVTDTSTVTAINPFGVTLGSDNKWNGSGYTYVMYPIKRAPSFFDVVCYTGTGVAGRTVAHNLTVAPELMIVKSRSGATNWIVYSNASGNTKFLQLNTTIAESTGATIWNNTTPTSSVFSLGTATTVNINNGTFVAYLFATCAGVSKVGSYTGTGATQTINCGFTAGSRFVLIKRTDSTGDWYVWDTARGIVAGNDPYNLWNVEAAQVTSTDYVDAYAAGFELSSTAPAALNASGGTYIFLAIA